ncbi:hypothetical protein E3J33_02130 [Candidatus Aerophobetes bacterium]|uniref:Uroporphyrinogen decarboxylase (URO-D) domain-containing protein n=3 Tax=root TaxID=1 RepID=A0A523YPE4_UNCAE|nr:MAG: hypothetical protein E3J33_02130 [Candidatus Aerophobetes bacterium]
MTDQTQATLAQKTIGADKLVIGRGDREILRRLAGRIAELAARPIEDEKRDLWYRHNALEVTRPLIFCDPENGWNEIITNAQIECRGELAREWEMVLRKEIFWGESMGDDRVIEPYFDITYVYVESDWGMQETKVGGENGGSYTWDSPLKSYHDLSKLHFPRISVDYEATDSLLSLAKKVWGKLLAVRLKERWWWSLGMTWTLVNLRGLEQIMFDIYDYPDQLHQLMGILRDGTLAKLDFLEENGLLSLNNDGTYVGSGGFGYTRELPQKDFDGKTIRTRDMWGFCESQETTTFSPEMFAEFIFPYQLPILERFGLNCYGCCEPLDKRWYVVKNAPRLRRVSVSAWANLADLADKLGERYIYSMKPHPGDLAVPSLNEERIRSELRRALQITRNCRVEIIMKDNHTIANNPQNVIRWCQIAREEAEAI